MKKGFIPSSMEQKWFCYYENSTLHFYRSWSGKLICSVIFNTETNQHIVVTYYSNEEEEEGLTHIDACKLTRCLIDGLWD